MTPKEKAIELVDGFRHLVDSTGDDLYFSHEEQTKRAKQCALICVDEVLKALNNVQGQHSSLYEEEDFYQEVKNELEKS